MLEFEIIIQRRTTILMKAVESAAAAACLAMFKRDTHGNGYRRGRGSGIVSYPDWVAWLPCETPAIICKVGHTELGWRLTYGYSPASMSEVQMVQISPAKLYLSSTKHLAE